VSAEVGEVAVSAYLIVALGVVPVLVPYAMFRSEPTRRRRMWMLPFVLLGVAVSFVLLGGLTMNPHSAAIGGRYIAYEVSTPGGGVTAGLYGAAVCAPLLLSSHRPLVVFGVVNVAALALLAGLLSAGLISLWCIWAAVWSIVIARHLRESSTAPSARSVSALSAG